MAETKKPEARYFIAKCANIASLKKCCVSGIWACRDRTNSQEQPRTILSQGLREGRVVLIFSVNNCHGWHGYCEMIDRPGHYEPDDKEEKGQVDGESGETIQWHYFRVVWKYLFLREFSEQCVPFTETEFLLPDGTPVNKSRNWQELPPGIGEKMCHLVESLYSELTLKRKQKENEKTAQRPPPFLESDDCGSVNDYWASVVEKVERELGRVHLACPFGSQRYNLAGPESDIDVFIVYQADTASLLGFNPPKQTIKNSDRERCDYTILELHRYCELLCGGDPRCVETLYMNQSTVIHSSPQWRQLTQLAPLMHTRQCLDKYLRDAQGSNGVKQYRKWCDENPGHSDLPAKINKLCYIIIRLLQNARDVVKKGPIRVFREEGSEERRVILSVRRGELTASQVLQNIHSLQEEIDKGRDDLTTDSPASSVEKWLLQQRYCNFTENFPLAKKNE
ncbi:uncharacterized protein LOC124141033 [Haliotis rufescens]|uniref:uncharacterized protein LOC124141033 n=1 Tax=Haliotis rufescens TaxID=6454 RepID=UPI00201F71EC|nr:uncharacterized protein LOC124141033 [Haliotis rufescens]XP_046364852.2 uncharacterized protein LOC124141033 [Haliotis rufescens]